MIVAAFVSWLDLTSSDRERMRRVLSLFDEQGTVDEMGLGVLRDAFSDALFPGTSSIQTRLRYVLFIPWIYMDLERRRVPRSEIDARARRDELALIAPLKASPDPQGTFGSGAMVPMGPTWGRHSEQWVVHFNFGPDDPEAFDEQTVVPHLRELLKKHDLINR